MTPPMLRHLWTIVEQTQSTTLLGFDDNSLVSWLIHQISKERSLSAQEADIFSRYIWAKLSLIRDLAQAR